MDYFRYIFYLGILYVVFSIIWFFIARIPKWLLSANREEKAWEGYLFKIAQFYFVSSLTLLKAIEMVNTKVELADSAVSFYLLGGLILYLYLYGKYERTKQFAFVRAGFSMMRGGKMPNLSTGEQNKYVPHLIGLTIAFYLISIMYPELIFNNINLWFLGSINDFYETIIIGFILSVIGFFFMISMVIKGVSATGELMNQLIALITGKPYQKPQPKNPFEQFSNFGGKNNPFENFQGNPFNQDTNQTEDVDLDDDDYVDFEYVDEDDK